MTQDNDNVKGDTITITYDIGWVQSEAERQDKTLTDNEAREILHQAYEDWQSHDFAQSMEDQIWDIIENYEQEEIIA